VPERHREAELGAFGGGRAADLNTEKKKIKKKKKKKIIK